jgi:PadR family transcriptional regulator, regulatory protein PadR
MAPLGVAGAVTVDVARRWWRRAELADGAGTVGRTESGRPLVICRCATYDDSMNTSKAEMREPTYFLLASLLDGPLHGYAIIQRAAELSDGRVRMATGTLYTALDRLTAEGYVRLVSEEIVNGRARRSYGLTESGSAALRAEATRMAAAAQLVTRSELRSRRGAAIRKERLA